MLVKQDLEKKIETAIHNAMKKAMSEMNKAMQDAVNGDGNGSDFSVSGAIDTFANEAKKCASDIASAIEILCLLINGGSYTFIGVTVELYKSC